MNNDLKIKINGDDTTDLFLAFLLLKKGFKVQLFKKHNNNKKLQKKFFFISYSIKLILENFNLWSQLKDKAYSIDSLSILDISILKKIDISFKDFIFKKSNPNNIGWIISCSDFYDLLFNEITKFEGVFSELDFKFNSVLKDSYKNKIANLNNNFNYRLFFPIFNKNNISSIEFTASLRGAIDNRHYSITSENGLIFLCPIYKNIFRIKWISKKSSLERTQSFGNSFLLDNLSTILPNELKIDQIFGALNTTSIYTEIFKPKSQSNNYLIIKKGPSKLLDFRLDGLNSSLGEVIFIYNQIKNINIDNIISIWFIKFKFSIFKYFKLKLSNFFYELFTINNNFIYFLKKIILYLIKNVKILKVFILKVTVLVF